MEFWRCGKNVASYNFLISAMLNIILSPILSSARSAELSTKKPPVLLTNFIKTFTALIILLILLLLKAVPLLLLLVRCLMWVIKLVMWLLSMFKMLVMPLLSI
jgi:hypothetical protein